MPILFYILILDHYLSLLSDSGQQSTTGGCNFWPGSLASSGIYVHWATVRLRLERVLVSRSLRCQSSSLDILSREGIFIVRIYLQKWTTRSADWINGRELRRGQKGEGANLYAFNYSTIVKHVYCTVLLSWNIVLVSCNNFITYHYATIYFSFLYRCILRRDRKYVRRYNENKFIPVEIGFHLDFSLRILECRTKISTKVHF